MRLPTKRKARVTAAAHEAAHCLIAVLTDVEIETVELHSGKGDRAGTTTLFVGNNLDAARAFYAGAEAELLIGTVKPFDLLEDSGCASDFQLGWELICAELPDGSQSERETLRWQLRREARAMLEANLDALWELARRLLDRGKLTGDEVRAVIGDCVEVRT